MVSVAALCCLPWTIRNYVVFHRFIPVRSNLPFELWLGNNDIFDEHARNGRKSITRTEEARRYAQLGETGYMAEKWELATSFMRRASGIGVAFDGEEVCGLLDGDGSAGKEFPGDGFVVDTGNSLVQLFDCDWRVDAALRCCGEDGRG